MLDSVKSTTLVSLAALFLASPALSADLKGDPTSADYVAERPFSWTGLYIGGRFGYGNANHELSVDRYNGAYCYDAGGDPLLPHDPEDASNPLGYDAPAGTHIDSVPENGDCNSFADDTPLGASNSSYPVHTEAGPDHALVDAGSREVASLNGLNSSGITGGAQLGYDQQLGRFLIGVFGSYDLSSMDTTASIGAFDMTLIEKGDEWSVGARFGYLLHPRVMAYVLAAYTQADWTFGDATTGEKEVTFDGVTVGGGLEYALTRNIFIGIEGTHTFYGKETILDIADEGAVAEIAGTGTRLNDEIGETKVLGTLKIKLNSDLGSNFGL